MPLTALFRCDASPKIGAGHATRSLALAEALARDGWHTIFASTSESVATVPALAHHQVVQVGGSPSDEPAEIRAAVGGPVDWLVVDHNGRDEKFESGCRTWAKHILVVADFADRRHDCDLLLDQTIGRESAADRALHEPFVPRHCALLLGLEYALVRDQFTRRRMEAKQLRDQTQEAKRVLMSFGGTDAFGLTPRILAALLARDPPFIIDVVTGAKPGAELSSLAGQHAKRVTLHHAVEDMGSLMLAADLAVGLAGTSGSERCALGLPSALFVPSEHYREISARFAKAGASEIVGNEVFEEADAIPKILALAADKARLARMAAAAFSLCDGLGATRTSGEMLALTKALQ
jgi:UDP-2,4-diacetamido-2,4,6-trideoxy-beta-L-altropyranose hydrolase